VVGTKRGRGTCPAELIVEVDCREKKPILFPQFVRLGGRVVRVCTRSRMLKAGDYRLAAAPKLVVVERKGCPLELLSCALVRKSKFRKQLRKLRDSAEIPVLLLDMRPSDLLDWAELEVVKGLQEAKRMLKEGADGLAAMVLAETLRIAMEEGVQVLWSGRGRADSPGKAVDAGRGVLLVMLAAADAANKMLVGPRGDFRAKPRDAADGVSGGVEGDGGGGPEEGQEVRSDQCVSRDGVGCQREEVVEGGGVGQSGGCGETGDGPGGLHECRRGDLPRNGNGADEG